LQVMKGGGIKTIVIAALVGAIVGVGIVKYQEAGIKVELTAEQRIADFYATETAVHVSPHHIRKAIASGDRSFVLVDLRSQEEYEREHIVGAINIPAYKDPETSAYGDVERIVGRFNELGTEKEVIVYCYSIPCMTGRKIGNLLAENGIYVKHLGVGWNEWRYFWNQWNHEHEWEITDVGDYVASGSEPGVFEGDPGLLQPCSIDAELGC
jgi:rhodanese-related sulfurtransferase